MVCGLIIFFFSGVMGGPFNGSRIGAIRVNINSGAILSQFSDLQAEIYGLMVVAHILS